MGGAPYWQHCQRVADRLEDPDEQVAALLHDVLEDTSTTANDLHAWGYSDRVIELVEAVTRPPNVIYLDWIRSIANRGDISAIRIKLADLADNSDPQRLSKLPPERRSIKRRYDRARRILETGLAPK